jgi:hypothetical protein
MSLMRKSNKLEAKFKNLGPIMSNIKFSHYYGKIFEDFWGEAVLPTQIEGVEEITYEKVCETNKNGARVIGEQSV